MTSTMQLWQTRCILPISMINDIRCPRCGWQGNMENVMIAKIGRCPNCGTTNPPLKLKWDGLIKTNWEDIRILCIYAQRFGATFDETILGNKTAIDILNRIVQDLARFQPPNAPNLDPHLKDENIAKDIEARKIRGFQSPYIKDLIKRDDDSKQ